MNTEHSTFKLAAYACTCTENDIPLLGLIKLGITSSESHSIALPLSDLKACIHVHVILRRGGLMVSALDYGASSPGLSPGQGRCAVFLGMTLYSHSASLHPGV